MKKNGKITFEESSGNVFADMGLDDADELLTRAKLGHSVRMILEKKKLKQREIGKLLEIKQPEVSNLMNGRYTLFSQERLIGFLNKLDRKVTVQVSRRRKGEALQEVVLT
jgi:predicted XRE-type DNA-binding protein